MSLSTNSRLIRGGVIVGCERYRLPSLHTIDAADCKYDAHDAINFGWERIRHMSPRVCMPQTGYFSSFLLTDFLTADISSPNII